MTNRSVQLIACGALAHETISIMRSRDWDDVHLTCLPAHLHNYPQKIPELLREKIRTAKEKYTDVAVLYGDCGTGGQIDDVCKAEGVKRIEGPHCYSFYSGNEEFERISQQDPTVYYLTDYLCRHFEKIVWQGLGLDKHPELLEDYFGNYSKLVYLAQTDNDGLKEQAREAAKRLSLSYEYRHTGMGDMEWFMVQTVAHSSQNNDSCAPCFLGGCHAGC